MKVKKNNAIVFLCVSLISFFCGNTILKADIDHFQYRYEIKNIEGTWNKIKIPNIVLATSENDLKDIRIYGVSDRDSIEIPYFVSPKLKKYGTDFLPEDDSLEKISVIPNISNDVSSSNETTVVIEFPEKISFSKLTLKTDYKYDYQRTAYAKYRAASNLKAKTTENKYLNIRLLSLNSDSNNTFYYENIRTDQLVLEISNHDNQPLKISDIELSEKKYYLTGRFEPGYKYYLYWGNKTIYTPKYDILNFLDKVPKVQHIAELKAFEDIKLVDDTQSDIESNEEKTILWVVIGLLACGLVFFTIKLLKKD